MTVAGERDRRWRAPAAPKDSGGFATTALVVALLVAAATFWVAWSVHAALADAGVASRPADILLVLCALASLALLLPAWRSHQAVRKARTAAAAGDIVEARVAGAAARTGAWFALGYAAAVLLLVVIALFVVLNDMAVGRTFFFLPLIGSSFWLVLKAFWTNVYIFCIAEVLVLVWGLRGRRRAARAGPPGRPIRMIATAYCDIFRGLPAIITIYLVGFGLPLTGLPDRAATSPHGDRYRHPGARRSPTAPMSPRSTAPASTASIWSQTAARALARPLLSARRCASSSCRRRCAASSRRCSTTSSACRRTPRWST
jgi:polar amino acid transport system permease protein